MDNSENEVPTLQTLAAKLEGIKKYYLDNPDHKVTEQEEKWLTLLEEKIAELEKLYIDETKGEE